MFIQDESAQGLLNEMKNNKDAIVESIGEAKFNEELETLKKIDEQEQKKGLFQSIQGDVDNRD